MIDKSRMLAITDGIIAVAATVMVLRLNIPDHVSMEAFHAQWPILLSYLISFVQVFLAWHEHHDALAHAERINHRIFLMNCLWLFSITMLPFVTGIVGRSPEHRSTMLLYIAILTIIEVLIIVLCSMIEKYNQSESLDADIIRTLRRVTFIGYALAAVCTFVLVKAAFGIIIILCLTELVLIWRYDRKTDI